MSISPRIYRRELRDPWARPKIASCESALKFAKNVVSIRDEQPVEKQSSTDNAADLGLKQHFRPFLVRSALLQGIWLKWVAEELALPNAPVNHNATKNSATGDEAVNPSFPNDGVSRFLELGKVSFLVSGSTVCATVKVALVFLGLAQGGVQRAVVTYE
jgi:hypothetical protein